MIDKLLQYLQKPELYMPSTSKFWDDEHISKGMLEAHLNPDLEAASRKHSFIDKSVEWINAIAPHDEYRRILDLGCGPGLYTQRMYNMGYSVTGIDFSTRSIDYAKATAIQNKWDINYVYKNYIDIDYNEEFDVVMLIYCDFGVLSHSERKILLNKIYKSLRKGGKFIFDVFTPKQYEGAKESSMWYINQGGGFWKDETYLCLEANYFYENNVRLNQVVVIDEAEKVDVYRIWDHYYTKEGISEEIKKAGFIKNQMFSDVSGTAYCETTKTLCIVAEK